MELFYSMGWLLQQLTAYQHMSSLQKSGIDTSNALQLYTTSTSSYLLEIMAKDPCHLCHQRSRVLYHLLGHWKMEQEQYYSARPLFINPSTNTLRIWDTNQVPWTKLAQGAQRTFSTTNSQAITFHSWSDKWHRTTITMNRETIVTLGHQSNHVLITFQDNTPLIRNSDLLTLITSEDCFNEYQAIHV